MKYIWPVIWIILIKNEKMPHCRLSGIWAPIWESSSSRSCDRGFHFGEMAYNGFAWLFCILHSGGTDASDVIIMLNMVRILEIFCALGSASNLAWHPLTERSRYPSLRSQCGSVCSPNGSALRCFGGIHKSDWWAPPAMSSVQETRDISPWHIHAPTRRSCTCFLFWTWSLQNQSVSCVDRKVEPQSQSSSI